MSDQMVTFRDARQLTGLLGATRRWSRAAHLEARRRGGGHSASMLGELKRAPGEPLQAREDLGDLARVLGGARVASRRQCSKHDLERPVAHPHERAVAPRPERELPVYFDVGSGFIDHGRAPRRVPARIQPAPSRGPLAHDDDHRLIAARNDPETRGHEHRQWWSWWWHLEVAREQSFAASGDRGSLGKNSPIGIARPPKVAGDAVAWCVALCAMKRSPGDKPLRVAAQR